MRILLCILLTLALSPAWAATVTTEEPGEVVFLSGTEGCTTIRGGAFGPSWEWTNQSDAPSHSDLVLQATRRQLTGTFPIGGASADVTFVEEARRVDADTLGVQYDFTVNQEVTFNSLWVSFFLPCDKYGGLGLVVRDSGGAVVQDVTLPEVFGDTFFFAQGDAATVEVASGDELGYTIVFSPTADIALQDNRAWGGSEFELRIELLGDYDGVPVPAGTQFSCSFTVDFPAVVDFQLDPYSAWSQTDTTGWIPFVLPWDSAPLDLSDLNDKPAGTHGFLTVADGRLRFEDGTPGRFWGVCVSAAGNFPAHEQSEKIAARMAAFGVNMVRTHHADAFWSDPNLFDERYGDTQHFDTEALDRFDYFLYCLKQNGIYVYLDQLVHRQFTEGDGVTNAAELPPAGKPYTLFDPTLIALQKQFSHDLWTHVNPYTGLAYKDDPAIALMEFTNENDIQTYDVVVEPYATDFEQMWRDWATAHGVNPDQPVRYVSERSSDVLRFIDEVQTAYYADMYAYLRSIGVRVPITGNTWLVTPANLPSQASMDYMDSHAYWDHPYDDYSRWTNRKQVRQDPRSEGNNFATLAMSRVTGMPFVCSEWGHPWPNEWRAEGPLPTAAIGAFQDWDGVLAYTYRHSTDVPVNSLTGAFNTFNDPCVFGLFPAAALMYRRGDVESGGTPTAVLWEDSDIFAVPQVETWSARPAYRSLVEATPVVTALTTPTGVAQVVGPDDLAAPAGDTWTASADGQLWRDWDLGVGYVNTPRSQVVYGQVGSAGTIALADVSFAISTPFASVAATSWDGEPLGSSRHLLITAVGRAENTGMRFNLTHTKLVDAGTGPILIEPVTGEVTIQTDGVRFCVSAVSPNGERTLLEMLEADGAGTITITLSPDAGSIYYEVVAAGRFRDVPINHWAFAPIEACAEAGIVGGFDDGTYRPDLVVSRDQMAVYVARALAGGEDLVPTGPAQPTFSDVPADHWAYRYIEYAVASGIVFGYDEGTYRPTVEVDRGQMAVYIARAIATPTGEAGLVGYTPPGTPTFSDVPADHWAYKYVEYVREQGVVQGYDDGTYRPETLCTRDQMAVYVARAFALPM